MEPIVTERLILREFNGDDIEEVHQYASDPEVTKYMVWSPNSKKQTKKFVEERIEQQNQTIRKDYDLAITLKSDGLIGACGIDDIKLSNKKGELGYCLNKQYWEKGYATETSEALLDLGFNDLELHRIFAKCDTKNLQSKNVLGKIGMEQEGILREHKIIDGRWRSSYIYSILEGEYSKIQENHL